MSHVERLVKQWEDIVGFARQMKEMAADAIERAASKASREFYQDVFSRYDMQEKCAQGGLDLYHAKYAPVYVFARSKVA